MEKRIIERMRDMQTEIIRVFMTFQERNESSFRILEKVDASLAERMGMIEGRLLQIEKKLLLNPPELN